MEERKSSQPLELFYCYARKDQILRKELDTHLTGLYRSGQIVSWNDEKLVAGSLWKKEIEIHLNTAHIILLLISPDFIRSDYCYGREMHRAIERHKNNETHVIPILLRPVDWTDAPFSELQALPTNALPITEWSSRDAAFTDVARGIREVVEELIKKPTVQSLSSSFDQQNMASPQPSTNHFIGDNPLSTQQGKWQGNASHPLHVRKLSRSSLGAIIAVLLLGASLLIYFSFHMIVQSPPRGSTKLVTSSPTSNKLLYQADWSNGLNGWSGSTDWKTVDSLLVSDGSNGSKASPTIEPPYLVNETPDYAVETRIQQVQPSNGQTCFDAAFIRGSTIPDGVQGYRLSIGCITGGATIYAARDSLQGQIEQIAYKDFQPGNSWHTYRLEAKGTTISAFIDNTQVMQINDSTFLSGGITGIKSKWTQINVGGFKVISQ